MKSLYFVAAAATLIDVAAGFAGEPSKYTNDVQY
jgi:hypothetical protein